MFSFKREKKNKIKRTQHPPKQNPRSCEGPMPSPKLGVFICLEESPGKHAPLSRAKGEGVFKPMAGMGDDELWG